VKIKPSIYLVSFFFLNLFVPVTSTHGIVYKDQNTPSPFVDHIPTTDETRLKNTVVDHVYLDCMGFGMGMCCLQVNSDPLISLYHHSIGDISSSKY